MVNSGRRRRLEQTGRPVTGIYWIPSWALEKIDFLWRVIRAGFSDTLEGSGQVQVPAVTPVYTGSAGPPPRALRSTSPSHIRSK